MKYYADVEGGYADRYVDQGNEYLGEVPETFDMSQLGEFRYVEVCADSMGQFIRRLYDKGETNCVYHNDYVKVSEYAILLND